MINMAVISLKDIIKYLVKITIIITIVVGLTRYFLSVKNNKENNSSIEKSSEAEVISENNSKDILVEKYLCLYGAQPFLIEEVEKLEVDAENDHRYFFYAPLATLELIDKSNFFVMFRYKYTCNITDK